MRKRMPEAPRAFKTPWVPVVPLLGIGICLFMMVFLPFDTWLRLVLWMLVGHDIYVFYGSKSSKLGAKKDVKLLYQIGSGIALFLATMVSIHLLQVPSEEVGHLPIIMLIVAAGHLVLFGYKWVKCSRK
jgi:APA family basic amino acid/polyamine antiporter